MWKEALEASLGWGTLRLLGQSALGVQARARGRVSAGCTSARGVAFYMSEEYGLPRFGDQSPHKPTLTVTWTSWGGESPHHALA